MITVAEIKAWLEDERDSALSQLRDEPNHNNNHLATAYSAEYEFAIRALQFIEEGETTRNVTCDFCHGTGTHLCPDVAEPITIPCSKKGCQFRKEASK